MINLTGHTYGELVVLSYSGRTQHGSTVWICQCACGNQTETTSNRLRTGTTKSCGCRNIRKTIERNVANTIHGHASSSLKRETPTYRSWQCMIFRCQNPSADNYPEYGGRGVTVCDRWRSFELFLNDLGVRPPRMTLDRIDVNGNYEPGNCRWATAITQGRNRRSNKFLTFNGETLTIAEWVERLGCKSSAIRERLRKGWSVERTLTEPIEHRNPRKKRS